MAKANMFDSLQHHEERKAKFEDESRQLADNQEIANFKGLPQQGETREQLLERIRKMRDEKPPEVETEGYRSDGMRKEFEAEQEAGRAAVAKAEAEQQRYQTLVTQAEADGGKK